MLTLAQDAVDGTTPFIPGLLQAAPEIIGIVIVVFLMLRSQRLREEVRSEEQRKRDELHAETLSELIAARAGTPAAPE